jgi:FKBP-type peptidyl-prolyl cis-trans isomerase FkpA
VSSRFYSGVMLLGMAALMAGCEAPSGKDVPVPVAPALPTTGAKPGPVDPDAPEEFTETPSGLKYRIRRKSDGRKPTAVDSVRVDYHGWLDGGKVFDSSYKRSEPTSFPLSRVIPAWTEGLQLIGEGGMIELDVPPELGYGADGFPPDIPPNARLHFLVELRRVI